MISINSVEWYQFDEHTAKYFTDQLSDCEGLRDPWKHQFAVERLIKLVWEIAESNTVSPTELAKQALSEIEADWSKTICSKTLEDFFCKDPINKEIQDFKEKAIVSRSEGYLCSRAIGMLGKFLWKNYSKDMNQAHWVQYRLLKKELSPRIWVGGFDINKASIDKLVGFFKNRFLAEQEALLSSNVADEEFEDSTNKINQKARRLAEEVFFARPFKSLEEVVSKGYVSFAEIGYTTNNVSFISYIKRAYRESIKFGQMDPLKNIASQIIQYQQQNPSQCTEEEWHQTWQTYKVAKQLAQSALE
jgi:hypothetical protein